MSLKSRIEKIERESQHRDCLHVFFFSGESEEEQQRIIDQAEGQPFFFYDGLGRMPGAIAPGE